MELYKLKIQERKFNLSKETPEDSLTDITRLANIIFADFWRKRLFSRTNNANKGRIHFRNANAYKFEASYATGNDNCK